MPATQLSSELRKEVLSGLQNLKRTFDADLVQSIQELAAYERGGREKKPNATWNSIQEKLEALSPRDIGVEYDISLLFFFNEVDRLGVSQPNLKDQLDGVLNKLIILNNAYNEIDNPYKVYLKNATEENGKKVQLQFEKYHEAKNNFNQAMDALPQKGTTKLKQYAKQLLSYLEQTLAKNPFMAAALVGTAIAFVPLSSIALTVMVGAIAGGLTGWTSHKLRVGMFSTDHKKEKMRLDTATEKLTKAHHHLENVKKPKK